MRLDQYRETLEEDHAELQTLKSSISGARPHHRVKRMKEILCQCEQNLDKFYEYLEDKVCPVLDAQTPQRDEYRSCSTVPVNPPRLVLNYDSPTTDEGKLRAAVLDDRKGRIVAVVATGKGGVGKTCALRGLADENRIKAKFPGGILYIQLGNDARLPDIVNGIAEIVEETGGSILARTVRAAESVEMASRKASTWFHAHTCLVLVDDIWKQNGIDYDVLASLGSMVNARSRLVYTTRDRYFLDAADKVVEFMEKETFGALSRQMLMTHAGFYETCSLDERNQKAFEAILNICQGLPLAFAIAGGSVFRYSMRKGSERKQDAWYEFYQDQLSKQVDLIEASTVHYGQLSKIVDVSLDVLDRENDDEQFCEWFRSFCVLQKQQRVPVHVFQKLWNLNSVDDAKRVVERFEDVSIVQVSREGTCLFLKLHDVVLDIASHKASKEGKTQSFFQTLVRNYMKFDRRNKRTNTSMSGKGNADVLDELENVQSEIEARPKSTGNVVQMLRKWFRRGNRTDVRNDSLIVRQQARAQQSNRLDQTTPNLEPHLEMDPNLEEVEVGICNKARTSVTLWHEWWDVEDDGYVHNNVCRMLRKAGFDDELLRLLSEPRWIVMRLISGGITSVEQDVAHGEAVAHNKHSQYPNHAGHLDMLRRAARLSAGYVIDNPREAWFQLHGRLLQHAKRSELTRRFLSQVEQCAPRPWLQASEGVLQQAGSSEVEVVFGPGQVLCTHLQADEIRVLWSSARGGWVDLEVARYDRRSSILKRVKLALEGKRGEAFRPVECASFVADGSSVVTAHWDGSVAVWDTQSGIGRRAGAHQCEHHSRFIDFLTHGQQLACWTSDHFIRLWDVMGGRAVGQPLRGHTKRVTCVVLSADGTRIVSGSWDRTIRIWDAKSGQQVEHPLQSHTGWVNCVAISADGTRIVSGSDDETIRVWDAKRGHTTGQPLQGHAKGVNCVALNADGTRVVSGSDDKTIRVWDAERGHTNGQPLQGHTSGVTYVALNADGTRIVSGSDDNTLRFWDVESGRAVGQPPQGHTGWVKCVALSADGTRIVSGSGDKTLRVWDAESGHAIGQPLQGHTDCVNCVALSADGTRIVSGSDDNTLRVWDAESGHAVGQPLQGHTDWVECVALSADGTRIVSGSDDRTLRVWDAHSICAIGQPISTKLRVIGVGISANGTHIVSHEGYEQRLWALKAHGAECVLTSSDGVWKRTLDALALTWSSEDCLAAPTVRVTTRAEHGAEITLGTCEEVVRNVNDGDVYFTPCFTSSCRIVR